MAPRSNNAPNSPHSTAIEPSDSLVASTLMPAPPIKKPRADGTGPRNSGVIPQPKYFAFWSTFPTRWPLFSHSLPCAILLLLIATRSLPVFQSWVQHLLTMLAMSLLRAAFIFTAILSMMHQTGALRRYALHFAERELSKIMNGTLVTLSDIQVDVWRGKVVVHDLIVHNKDREDWDWESPCLARVGRIEATLNFASVIDIPNYGRILNHTFLDVYTALVEDVQVFIEKRRNVFNFHLLDSSLNIPDVAIIMEGYREKERASRTRSLPPNDGESDGESFLSMTKSFSLDQEDNRGVAIQESTGLVEGDDEDSQVEANRIVERLVGGLSNLGKATSEGGTKGLQSALRNQKENWVKNLRKLYAKNSPQDLTISDQQIDGDNSVPPTKKTPSKLTKDKVAEGIDVFRALGKVVEKNVAGIKENMEFLQKPPPKKDGWVSKPANDLIRIGSFLLREMRIFTKEVLGKGQNASIQPISNASKVDNATLLSTIAGNGTPSRKVLKSVPSGWSPPIVVWEMAITGAEFSPPMSARDVNTGLPVLGISIDRAVDIIVKRLLAETAKSNTGRLFQTAFGDVFSFVEVPKMKKVSDKAGEKASV